jgi:hypothetical protein
MKNLHKLMRSVANAENDLQSSEFIAPCLPNEKVAARLSGLLYQFSPEPTDYEGWGIFLPEGPQRATLVGEADHAMITNFLRPLSKVRLFLAKQLAGKSWLGVPADDVSAHKLQKHKEIVVHLVREGDQFDQVNARIDTNQKVWFEEIDPLAEPQHGDYLRRSLVQKLHITALHCGGLTPEMKLAYRRAVNNG